MKPTLSVAVIAYNVAADLDRSLASVAFADEIIVVDQGSTDDTVKIAKSHSATVVHQEWLGFGKQKNVAIAHCTKDWVLSLDSDEVVSVAGRSQIERALAGAQVDGFYLPRLSFIGKHPVHHSGWYPDYQLRLVRREQACFEEKEVHERMVAPASVAYLSEPLLHYTYASFSQWLSKINRYTDSEVAEKPFSLVRLLFKPPLVAFRCYFLWSGWRDGMIGWAVAASNYTTQLWLELKRWEAR